MFDMVIGTRGQTFVLARDFNAALKACERGTVATIPASRNCWHVRNSSDLTSSQGVTAFKHAAALFSFVYALALTHLLARIAVVGQALRLPGRPTRLPCNVHSLKVPCGTKSQGE